MEAVWERHFVWIGLLLFISCPFRLNANFECPCPLQLEQGVWNQCTWRVSGKKCHCSTVKDFGLSAVDYCFKKKLNLWFCCVFNAFCKQPWQDLSMLKSMQYTVQIEMNRCVNVQSWNGHERIEASWNAYSFFRKKWGNLAALFAVCVFLLSPPQSLFFTPFSLLFASVFSGLWYTKGGREGDRALLCAVSGHLPNLFVLSDWRILLCSFRAQSLSKSKFPICRTRPNGS